MTLPVDELAAKARLARLAEQYREALVDVLGICDGAERGRHSLLAIRKIVRAALDWKLGET